MGVIDENVAVMENGQKMVKKILVKLKKVKKKLVLNWVEKERKKKFLLIF